jgi:hypothetical protein
MSLPQRKKSAEEIAKLRESLGVPGPPPDMEVALPESVSPPPEEAPVAAIPEAPAVVTDQEVAPAAPLAPIPVAEPHTPKPVRSLKRSERIPVLPVVDTSAETTEPAPATALPEKTALPALQLARPVRSLRKSEQVPVTGQPHPTADSKLPVHRHSEREISEIRRQEALAMLSPQAPPKPMTAHLALVIPGYLAAAAGAACFHFYDIEKRQLPFTATCAAIALLVAAFIFVRRPLSRHHAAFIAVMALFLIVFGALYYFPQLQHGT